MNTIPYLVTNHEPTKKQTWLAAFTALLHHMSPAAAHKAADESLQICEEKWRNPKWVSTWQYEHSYPIGYQFIYDSKERPKVDSLNPPYFQHPTL